MSTESRPIVFVCFGDEEEMRAWEEFDRAVEELYHLDDVIEDLKRNGLGL